jgi:dihydroorotate dehydrogenase electron transfer subunit
MEKKILQKKVKIVSNARAGRNYFLLRLKDAAIAKVALPGQFIGIKVNDACEPLLRRPLSIHRAGGADIALLYEALGPATKILSKRKAGEFLDILGPLGNGFNYRTPCLSGRQANTKHRTPILVAGGMGIAPLLFLAEKLNNPLTRVLIGAKSKEQILCEKEFKKSGCSVKIATDDGSRGFKGKVTDLLKQEL